MSPPHEVSLVVEIITQLGVPGVLLVWLYFMYKGRDQDRAATAAALLQEREERQAVQARYEALQAESRTFLRETLIEVTKAISDLEDHIRR